MGYYKYVRETLDEYLARGMANKDKPIRKLNEDEMQWIDDLRKCRSAMNGLASEIITIRTILDKIGEKKLFYISQNLHRITKSLIKQRDYGIALRLTIGTTIPKPEDIPQIRRHIRLAQTRIEYLRKSVIPDNLEFTPIREYLEIIGEKDLSADIFRRFGNRFNLYEANTKRNEEIDSYTRDIMALVHEKGMEDRYRARLQKYIAMEDAREAKNREEKRREKEERDISVARDGMLAFQRMFNKGIRTLGGCKTIMMGRDTVINCIAEYGRDIYVVLCCYVWRGRCVYRYLGKNGQLIKNFCNARIFREGFEAVDAMSELEKAYPDKVFDVADLGTVSEYAC